MITLPEKFANDIQGKDTFLTPLIILNDQDEDESKRTYLSTGKITLGGFHYDPFIKSLGSIKQSINISDKRFKISSVDIEFYNQEKNNKTLTEIMFSSEIMNTRLDIYFKSQSAETIDDCLLAYSGYIKNVEEDHDTVTLSVEDRTEQTLHKDLPKRYTQTEELPDNRKNKIIPIVYGTLERSPLVYEGLIAPSEYSLMADDFYIKSISYPKVFHDDVYGNIADEALLFEGIKEGTIYSQVDTSSQYEIEESLNRIIFPKPHSVSIEGNPPPEALEGLIGNLPSFNFVEVQAASKVFIGDSPYKQWADPFGEDDYVEGNTKVLASKDLDGSVPTSSATQSYIKIQDFTDMLVDKWRFGVFMWQGFDEVYDNSTYPATSEQLGNYLQNTAHAETLLNFELEPFFSDGFITEIEDVDGEDKEVIQRVNVEYSASAEVENHTPFDNPNWDPQALLRLIWGRSTVYGFWNMNDQHVQQVPEGGGEGWDAPYQISNSAYGSDIEFFTKDISSSKFEIGNRTWDLNSNNYSYSPATDGVINWLNFETFLVKKTVIMSDFDGLDLYASVEGRVDTEDGRYTTNDIETLLAESRRRYEEDPSPQSELPWWYLQIPRVPTAPPSKPIKAGTRSGRKPIKKKKDKGSAY